MLGVILRSRGPQLPRFQCLGSHCQGTCPQGRQNIVNGISPPQAKQAFHWTSLDLLFFLGWRRPRHSTRFLFAGRGLVGRTQSHCIEREARLATCFLVACSVAGDSQPLQDIESFSACEWECLREKKPRPNQYNVISTGKYPTNISPLPLLRC